MKKSTSKQDAAAKSADDRPSLGLAPALAKLWAPKRHLLDTSDLTADEAQCILELSSEFKRMGEVGAPYPVLAGKTVANVFYENSTRTRSSFQLAARRLGAEVLNLDVASSSVAKGENLRDTARTLISMGVDAIIQRHSASGSAHLIADQLGDEVSVINAGDGWHAHPTQALLDLLSMSQVKENLRGSKMAIVGDILHSRVARSNIALLQKFGVDIHVVGPPTLLPPNIEDLGVTLHTKLEDAIEGADFVMALRLQIERQQQGLISSLSDYKKLYRLDHSRLRNANPNVRVLHPGPSNRGVEITDALHDDPIISIVNDQVANGVLVRMSVLYLLLNDFSAD